MLSTKPIPKLCLSTALGIVSQARGETIPPENSTTNATIPAAVSENPIAPASAPDRITLPKASTAEQENVIVVTAKRRPSSLKEIPASVTIIGPEDLAKQRQATTNVTEILGNNVTGMAPATGTRSSFGQSLRGRSALILLDGVPQQTNRSIGREFAGIDAFIIDRIEIVRGSTAAYGQGATGGLIHFLSKTPQNEGTQMTSSFGFQDTIVGNSRDGLGINTDHIATNRRGAFYQVFGLGLSKTKGFYDAHGQRIAPDPSQIDESDSTRWNIFAKAGWDNPIGRLSASIIHHRQEQDSSYYSSPSVLNEPAGQSLAKAQKGLQLSHDPFDQQTQLSLRADDMRLSSHITLAAQIYSRDFTTRFYPSPFLSLVPQSTLTSRTRGARLQADFLSDTSTSRERSLLSIGADYSQEKSRQTTELYNTTIYTNSNGRQFDSIGQGPDLSPPITLTTTAAFAQAEWPWQSSSLTWRFGIRQEHAAAEIENFTGPFTGAAVNGGSVAFDETLLNLGAVYSLAANSEIFAGYAQGFSIPDIGAQLRVADSNFHFDDSKIRGIKTDTYELGARQRKAFYSWSASSFYSRSDLNLALSGYTLKTYRAPEHIYGFELETKAWNDKGLSAAVAFTWSEGRGEDSTGKKAWLSSYRIPAPKLTSIVAYAWTSQIATALQGLYSAGRSRGRRTVEEPNIEPYAVFNLTTSTSIGHSGRASLACENILNRQYRTTFSQLAAATYGNTSNLPAKGRHLKARYEHNF